MSVVSLPPGETLALPEESARFSWLQVLAGSLALGAHRLEAGDGVAVRNEGKLALKAQTQAQAILLDLHGAQRQG